jgi:hypothetical protein
MSVVGTQEVVVTQVRRWTAPLAVATLAGWIFALLSGSTLLFFVLASDTRENWVFVHWAVGLLAMLPYALYQLRHYLRVRRFAQQTHYRVGLHAFWLALGAIASGALLIATLERGTQAYSVTDLAHIFFGFAFTLLLCAHLTLVAILTQARAAEVREASAGRAISRSLTLASVAAVALMVAATVYAM